jgi:Skp1 family, dimerisation domain
VTLIPLLDPHSPVRTLLGLFPDTKELPTPQLDSTQLQTAFEWVEANRHSDYQVAVDRITNQWVPISLSERDRKLVEGKGPAFYASMLEAAHYLGIPSLRQALNQTLAAMLRAMTAEEVRQFLGDPNPPSQEQRAAAKKRDVWAGF